MNANVVISCIVGIIGCTIGIIGFFKGREDKSNKDTKDGSYHLGQIDTRLKNIEEILEQLNIIAMILENKEH